MALLPRHLPWSPLANIPHLLFRIDIALDGKTLLDAPDEAGADPSVGGPSTPNELSQDAQLRFGGDLHHADYATRRPDFSQGAALTLEACVRALRRELPKRRPRFDLRRHVAGRILPDSRNCRIVGTK